MEIGVLYLLLKLIDKFVYCYRWNLINKFGSL